MICKSQIENWYIHYHYEVFKYINSFVRDRNVAEDLMQDTFVKAYVKANSYKGNSNVKTWLFRIAYNVTMDFFRKQKLFKKCEDLLIVESRLNENFWFKQESEGRKDLWFALNNLKASYKKVIILRKIKGYSVKETGEILNWSESKVKVTLSRALKQFRKQLNMNGIYHDWLKQIS